MKRDVPGLRSQPNVTVAQLERQHQELDKRLLKINNSRHLTPSEESEVRKLKRLKLHTKDRIHHLNKLNS